MELVVSYSGIILATITFLLCYLLRKKGDPRYPPGPTPLPLIGNIHQIGLDYNKTFQKWAWEYGPAFLIRVGGELNIFLNDPKLIKDLFSDSRSSGRQAKHPVFERAVKGNYGLILAEGQTYEEQKRFIQTTLKELGFGKASSSMEDMILEEVKSMLNYIGKRLDKPTSGYKIFTSAVINALWNLLAGEREEWDVLEKPEMSKRADQAIESINKVFETGLFFLPVMRHIVPGYSGWNEYCRSIDRFHEVCSDSIERHRKKLDPNSPKDLIDQYLLKILAEGDESSSFYGEAGAISLKAVLFDLFIAGSETNAHTMSWVILYLALYPEVQRKLQDELDTVVGSHQLPSLSDRPNLPFVEATIMEVLRDTSIVPTGLPHRMLEDVFCHGMLFPKDAIIFANTYFVHHNPDVWRDPENFRPERFLSPDGKSVVRHEGLVPFSWGKRQCLGKPLAEDTLFLFTASIFQKYSVRPDPNSSLERFKKAEISNKILNEPGPFEVIFSERN